MNPLPKHDPFQQQLERLVDGELSYSQIRDLLIAIEREPDGWRRCAMTFLEEQTWRGEFVQSLALTPTPGNIITRSPSTELERVPSPVSLARSDSSCRRHSGSWWPTLVAASVIGFICGFVGPRVLQTWSPNPIRDDTMVATPARETDRERGDETAESPTDELAPTETHYANSAPPWTLFVPTGSYSPRTGINLPLVAFNEQQYDPTLHSATTMSDELAERLRQEGNIVRRHQQIETIRLSDGRAIAIPIEDWEIVPVSLHGIP